MEARKLFKRACFAETYGGRGLIAVIINARPLSKLRRRFAPGSSVGWTYEYENIHALFYGHVLSVRSKHAVVDPSLNQTDFLLPVSKDMNAAP